jgi:hypothetical protein
MYLKRPKHIKILKFEIEGVLNKHRCYHFGARQEQEDPLGSFPNSEFQEKGLLYFSETRSI